MQALVEAFEKKFWGVEKKFWDGQALGLAPRWWRLCDGGDDFDSESKVVLEATTWTMTTMPMTSATMMALTLYPRNSFVAFSLAARV